jgi:iron(III) transport system permease protein
MGAALTVHVLTMFVYFFMFVSAALERFDWELVAAARSLGASRPRAFFTVVLPLLRPALLGASALTFMASMASFTAPWVFGGGERYLTTAIFIARMDDPPAAAALAVVLALASLACASLFRRTREPLASASKGAPPAPLRRSPVAIAARTLLAAVLVLATLLPLATLVLISFKPQGRIGDEPLLSGLTHAHYRAILASVFAGGRAGPGGELAASIGRSLAYSAVATVANVAFALALVLGVPERWRATKRVLVAVSMLPIAIPGTVLGLALLQAFATGGPYGLGPALAQSVAILPFAYFVRNLPILVQAASAAAAQLPASLPEASRTLGAGPARTLFRVTLPLMAPGVAAGAVMAFLIATGEFVASILLYTPRTQPASVAIYAEFSQGEWGTAAAAGVVLIVVVLAVAATVMLVLGRRQRRLSGATPVAPSPVAA